MTVTSPMQTERLGRYQLLDPIGSGPCGTVSRAKVFGVAGFERQFAVKRFAAEITAMPAQAQALSAAARAYGSLEHPRIARMSEFGVAQGTTFTAVELVTGLDAARLIAEARANGATLAVGGALQLVSQAARAVGYAHGRGLSHLGLSPTNVIVTVEGDTKITDFGILSATLPPKPTEVPRIAARIQYLAPEQLANEATSAATDVWALGVLAYELVTGQRTWKGETAQQVASSVIAGAVPEPPLPRPILRVLQRCLARSPFERFPDARALADALDAAIRVAPVPGTRKDIGAQVKTTLDRVAAQNEGELSGMLAVNAGSGPGPRLDQIAQLGQDAGNARDSRPSAGELSTTEFVRPQDRPSQSGSRDSSSPINTLQDMPISTPMTTVPGLAPPPIPVPQGIGVPSAIPAPPASNAPSTLLGIANAPKAPAPPPKPVLGAVPPPARPPTNPVGKIPSIPGAPKFRENHTPPPIPPRRNTPPPIPVVKPPEPAVAKAPEPAIAKAPVPIAAPPPAIRPRIDTPPPLPAPPGNTEPVARVAPATLEVPALGGHSKPSDGDAFERMTTSEQIALVEPPGPGSAKAPQSMVMIAPRVRSAVADFDAGIYIDDDGEPETTPIPPPEPESPANDFMTVEQPPIVADKLAAASVAPTGEMAPLVAEAAHVHAMHELDDAPSEPIAVPMAPMPMPEPIAPAIAAPPIAPRAPEPIAPRIVDEAPNPVSRAAMSLAELEASAEPRVAGLEPPTWTPPEVEPPRPSRPPERAPAPPLASGSQGNALAPQDSLAMPKPSRMPFIIVGSIAGLAVLGTGGYFLYDWLTTDDTPQRKKPPVAVVSHDAAPAKAPEDAAQVATGTTSDAAETVASIDAAPAEPPPDAAPKPTGDLVITSVPTGARVYIDGADSGTTPFKQPGTADHHSIALVLPAHELYQAQVDGRGKFEIQLKAVTPTGGEAGIKVIQCKVKDRYYVSVDGKPTGQTCPTERIETTVGPHVVDVYDLVSETHRKWEIDIKDTRLSYRIRIDPN